MYGFYLAPQKERKSRVTPSFPYESSLGVAMPRRLLPTDRAEKRGQDGSLAAKRGSRLRSGGFQLGVTAHSGEESVPNLAVHLIF